VNRSEPAVSDVLNAANSSVDADKRDLPNLEKEAMAASASTKFATNAADAFLSYEQYEKAEALYQNALGRPGVDAALANMRLGIAQLSLGKLEDAKASFAKVTGQRRPVAALWTVYADQLAKESGTSAEAAAEAASEI
jgi:tetratricopeptide (TPR) repeat protein